MNKFVIVINKIVDVDFVILFLGGFLLVILLEFEKTPNLEYITATYASNYSDVSNANLDSVATMDSSCPEVTVVRANGNQVILPLEEYLIGVVAAEMPATFPMEALKSQAIVARTYTLKKIKDQQKITDSSSFQSYKDDFELKKLWKDSYDIYYQKIKDAVNSTEGIAIYYEGNYIDAVYHSTSNGKTEDAVYVWGNSVPYLKSVDSIWDKETPSYSKQVSIDFDSVLNLLGVPKSQNNSLEILARDDSGRVLKLKIGNKIFTGVEIRNLLKLRSTDFDLSLDHGYLVITTRGYGHGVGMSQYGASGMAQEGYHYQEILKHYYTGVEVY